MCTLQECAYGGHLQFLNILIDAGQNLNEVDENGRTALYEAAKEGNIDIVERLIKAGAYVD